MGYTYFLALAHGCNEAAAKHVNTLYIYMHIYIIYIYYIYVLYYIYNAYGDKALNICRKKLCTSRTGESQGPVFMVVDTVSHKNWKSYLYHIIIT